jgi:hypothetical protein
VVWNRSLLPLARHPTDRDREITLQRKTMSSNKVSLSDDRTRQTGDNLEHRRLLKTAQESAFHWQLGFLSSLQVLGEKES